jgi:hypothetical protein
MIPFHIRVRTNAYIHELLTELRPVKCMLVCSQNTLEKSTLAMPGLKRDPNIVPCMCVLVWLKLRRSSVLLSKHAKAKYGEACWLAKIVLLRTCGSMLSLGTGYIPSRENIHPPDELT